MTLWMKLSVMIAGAIALPSGSLADCAEELRIASVSGLSFGIIAAAPEGGVIVVSPSGAVASLGSVGAGPGAQPGSIQLCGPAGARFLLLFEPAEIDVAAGRNVHRPHLVQNLELVARGGDIHPGAPGQWKGMLGRSGRADISVGGTLTVPPRQIHDTFAAPFRIAVIAAD